MKMNPVFKAVLSAKCPRCYTGNLYKHSLLKVHQFTATHEHCPHCALRFEQEPGFFFGAMYISYAFSVGILLTTGFVLFFGFNDPPFIAYALSIPAVVLLLLPLSFRYSRVVYLFAFSGIDYNPSFK